MGSKERTNIVVADVYLFFYETLEKSWTGIIGKSKRDIEFNTSDAFLREADMSPEDAAITVVTDIRVQTSLLVREE